MAFAFLLTLTLIVAGAGYCGMHSLSNEIEQILHVDSKTAEHSARARANTANLRRYEKDYFLNLNDAKKKADYLEKWNDERTHLVERLNDLKKLADDKEEIATVNQMLADLQVYEEQFTKVRA